MIESNNSETVNWKELYIHEHADFENYRKRILRDKLETIGLATSDIIKNLIPSIDNLYVALTNVNENNSFVEGINLIYNDIIKVLKNNGAEPIDALGKEFDINYHYAVAQLPSKIYKEGIIIKEISRGWILNGNVIRPSNVIVSSGEG